MNGTLRRRRTPYFASCSAQLGMYCGACPVTAKVFFASRAPPQRSTPWRARSAQLRATIRSSACAGHCQACVCAQQDLECCAHTTASKRDVGPAQLADGGAAGAGDQVFRRGVGAPARGRPGRLACEFLCRCCAHAVAIAVAIADRAHKTASCTDGNKLWVTLDASLLRACAIAAPHCRSPPTPTRVRVTPSPPPSHLHRSRRPTS